MAVGRSLNVKGQMRIDVPHLRLIESGVVYDFDTLAGGILAGKLPYVVTGFVPAAWINGSPASSLSLVTADSIFVNYQASENGSMLMVPADRVPEQLTITNSRVSGSFTVSQTNYVSLDLIKTEDDSTSDVVHFIDPATSQGTPKIIPLGRTMDYQIHITTAPFSTTPQRCPVMIVVTDAANNIVSVTDARPMMFRLASGGDAPNVLAKYSWPQGRTETANTFVGGDKAIGSMKDWVSAIEEMIWQINAGEYWYSNTQMTSTWFMPGAIGDWTWNGTTLTWANPLTIVFTGSTAITNTIAAGSINLIAGNAAYVDFNRYTDGAALTVYQAAIQTMGGEPATPGIRYPFAWRLAAGSPAIRNLPVPAGSSVVGMATTTTLGTVYLNTASATPRAVISDALNGRAVANGITRSTVGSVQIGGQTNDTSVVIGNITTNTMSTIYSAGTITLATDATGGTYYIGRFLGYASTSTINIGSTDVGSYTINIGASTDSSGGVYNIGTGLTTGNTNTINIGTGHAGTGASTITIGTALGKARAGAATAGGDNILTLATKGYVDSVAGGATPGIATTTVAGSVYINTASATPYAVVSSALGGSAVAGGLTRGALGSGVIYIGDQSTDVNTHVGGSYTTNLTLTAQGTGGNVGITANHDINIHSGISSGTGNVTLNVPSGSIIGIGSQLATGLSNEIWIGSFHTGTGHSAIRIGELGTSAIGMWGAPIDINSTGTGATVIGNATSKASAAAATVVSDPALTLATKGYVDGAAASWVAFTLSGTWATHAGRAFSYKLQNGIVYFRGALTPGGTPATYIGSLPVAVRPTEAYLALLYFSSSGAALNGAATIEINPTNGDIVLFRPGGTYGSTWGIPQTGDIFEIVGSYPVA